MQKYIYIESHFAFNVLPSYLCVFFFFFIYMVDKTRQGGSLGMKLCFPEELKQMQIS